MTQKNDLLMIIIMIPIFCILAPVAITVMLFIGLLVVAINATAALSKVPNWVYVIMIFVLLAKLIMM